MASQALLSTLETSHSFPNSTASRTSSHSSSASALASSPSLYVTFKVLQLVNSFRKRVKTRVQSNRRLKKETSTRVAQDFCQDLELQAFQEIDKYLGRKTTARSRKTVYPNSIRRSNGAYEVPSLKRSDSKRTTVATAADSNEESISSKSIQWLLDELNRSVKSDTDSLSAVATNHKLFVERKSEFHIERLSLKELTYLLVVVRDLLNTLKRTPSSRFGVRTLSEGNELLDLSLDETNTANLEHLLLCLRDQLLRLLIAQLIELVHKHVIECQRDQSKHREEWFFEFPDARHPLSTTWPWSIRPSLAVIWGVCWMFYNFREDQNGNMYDESGRLVMTRQQIEALYRQHGQNPSTYPANNSGQAFSPQGSHSAGGDPRLPRAMQNPHSPSSEELMTQPPLQQAHRGLTVATSHAHYSSSAPDQAAHAAAGLAIHGTNNTYTAAPPAYDTSAPSATVNYWLPQDTSAQNLGFQDNAYRADDVGQWQELPPQSVPEQQPTSFGYLGTLPPRSRNLSAPDIRVTIPEFQQQPQDNPYSGTPLSSTSSVPLQETANYYHFNQGYSTAHLSPQNAHPHHLHFMHPEHPDMQTTTPPHSPSNVPGGAQISRKRSHSEMSGGAPQMHPHPPSAGGSRSGSVASLQPDQSGEEEPSPRSRTIKRGDPPQNEEGKFICNTSPECSTQTFDRKCEWSKHMDKHDRPYRCPHTQCAKLQGFTYSGGLLRHEREVHGKHGGPKAQLMCPHDDCKRHSGKGFTRKENLNEHLRRVHQNKDSQSQTIPLKREVGDAMPGAEDVETPASHLSETQVNHEDMPSPTYKRRRIYNPGPSERSASEGVDDLRHEVDNLRRQNADKDTQILQMRSQLEEVQAVIRQMQQQGQQGQG